MISLGQPLALAASAALAVPLLVHLIRRSDRRVVSFAALQFLSDRNFPRSEWDVHQRVLLALRLLLIAVLTLLLTSPAWRGASQTKPPWIVVASGVDVDTARGSVQMPRAEWHWLSPGFPLLSSRPEPEGSVALASLVRQLDAELPLDTALVAVVPATLGGLDDERLRLGRAVQWRVVPGSSPDPTLPSAPSSLLKIVVRYDAAGAAELPVARGLAAAWAADGLNLALDIAPVGTAFPDASWLIWLGGPMTSQALDWVRRGGQALVSRAAPLGQAALIDSTSVLFQERLLGKGRIVSSTYPLIPARMPDLLEPRIASRLRQLLSAPVMPPDRALAANVAPLRRDVLLTGETLPLVTYLGLCAASIFLVERLWATRRAPSRDPRR